MLATIRNRLSDFHNNDLQGLGYSREETIQREGEEVCAIAHELGIFKKFEITINEVSFDAMGAEHGVAYNDRRTLIKLTLPNSGFGLIPKITRNRKLDLRTGEEVHYSQIEFLGASPLEYLDRWQLCNDLFGDAVDVKRVIQWSDESISIMISQPYYIGDIVTSSEIHDTFIKKSWEGIYKDGRAVFYNYAHDAVALDLEPRNCYMRDGRLQPFDVIVSHPDEEMRAYLGI